MQVDRQVVASFTQAGDEAQETGAGIEALHGGYPGERAGQRHVFTSREEVDLRIRKEPGQVVV